MSNRKKWGTQTQSAVMGDVSRRRRRPLKRLAVELNDGPLSSSRGSRRPQSSSSGEGAPQAKRVARSDPEDSPKKRFVTTFCWVSSTQRL